MARKIEVQIVGDSRSLEKAFKRSSDAGKKFSVSMGTIAKSALVFGAVDLGVRALGAGVRTAFGEFSDMATVAAQTEAALKSTGNSAGVTAKHVDELARSISAYSGEDDEAVQAAENLLLTFKAVRNEAGKGNQIFDRATRAAADLARAGFGSLATNAKQLGKVLNDPVKGMTALSRAGVTFTAAQRKTIKALAESGKLLEAQKLVLSEVESQVGGSAKAFGKTLPGQLKRMSESFKNTLGGLASRVAEPLADALGSVNRFVDRIGEARTARAKFSIVFEGIQTIGRELFDQVKAAIDAVDWPAAIATAREGLFDALRRLGDVVGQIDWGQVGRAIGKFIATGFQATAAFLQSVDWGNVGRVIVKGIADFLKSVDWKAVAVSTVKLVAAAFIAVRSLLLGIGKELGGQLMAGIGRGLDEAKDFVLRKLLQFVNRVLGVTGFLGRFDPFKGVREKVQAQLRGMEQDAADSAKKIQGSFDSIKGASVNLSVDASTGRREEGAAGRASGARQAGKKVVDAAKTQAAVVTQAAATAQKTNEAAAKTAETAAEKAEKAKQRQRSAFERLLGGLDLRLDRASARGAFKQELAVLADQQRAVQAQIRVEGRTLDLERKLFDIEQSRLDVRGRLNEQAKAARQTRQFRALGLDAEGNKSVPGIANLQKQLASLSQRVKGTPVDTGANRALLNRIRKVLTDPIDKATVETRQKIKELFSAIREGFDEESGKGPQTKTTGLNTKKLLAGLGLDADEARRLRGRLSGFNSAGMALARTPTATAAVMTTALTVPVSVQIDGREIARADAKYSGRDKRVNTSHRNGPRAGGR